MKRGRRGNWGQTKPTCGTPINMGHSSAVGLVGRYAMLEGAGNIIGNSANLALMGINNGATWRVGPSGLVDQKESGPSLSFDGSASYVDLGQPAALDFTTAKGGYTITAWVLTNTVTGLQNAFGRGDNVSLQYGMLLNGGNWTAQCTSGGDVTGQALSIGIWYFIAIVLDAVNLNAYTNGVLNNSGARSTTSKAQNSYIGADKFNSRFWNGLIRDVCYWNRPKPADEIWSMYQSYLDMFATPRRRAIKSAAAASSKLLLWRRRKGVAV